MPCFFGLWSFAIGKAGVWYVLDWTVGWIVRSRAVLDCQFYGGGAFVGFCDQSLVSRWLRWWKNCPGTLELILG